MEKKLKIAIFESSRTDIGGSQKVIQKISKHLSEKHEVEIFTQKLPDKKDYFGDVKVNIIRPQTRFFSSIAFLLKKVTGFDLIILGSFPANLGSIRNTPTLTLCYTPTREFYDLRKYLLKSPNLKVKLRTIVKNILFKKLDYIASSKTDRIMSISATVKNRVNKEYKRDSTIFYPGIDSEDFESGKYENYILSVARFVGAKRVDVLIKSMKFVKNKEVQLYLVGCGEDDKKIRNLAENTRNVKVLGAVSSEELKKLYSNCLAVAYIPLNEDYGLVPLEAGASKKAIIGSDEGGLRETIVNNKTGFLIKNPSPKKIAEKIDILFENKELAKKMGNQAYNYIKKFDWSINLKKLDNEIQELLKNN